MYFCYKVRLVRNMEAKRIERVRLMESALNRWIKLGNEDLITYYSSTDWFIDKESSDRNEFPEDLLCGVLSEDTVFDVLTQLHGLLQMTREIEAHMREVPQRDTLPPIPD